MAHDRADSDELPLTQEFLAVMLCVHRPSINVVARMLQQANIIRYSQGRITVLDRDGLEVSIGTQKGPPIGVQKGPLSLRIV
jgi:hypothetical protein